MNLIERESSKGKSRGSSGVGSRLLLISLVALMLASAGCGSSQDQAAVKPGATPDEQAKFSRDNSRALHEKSKGRTSAPR